MADGTIAIQDEAKAEAWLAKCRQNNEELNACIEEVGALLKAVADSSEGDVVDSFMRVSTVVKNVATHLFSAVSEVSTRVSSLIGIYKGLRDKLVGVVSQFAGQS